ncbi:hypothetical protein BKA69DRAFT_1127006 [Paraphysoderma sedebokerense]|nr:hypothetical protein BKA69DRAFT_1127006 [Paraphysoderma sedebokerense]
MYDSDMVERLDDEYDPPAHLECEMSDSATAISGFYLFYGSSGPPSSIAHKPTSNPSSLTAEADRSTPQFRSIDNHSSMENQLPIDGIYHRYISRDQFESCYCYTGYNVIVMWDHQVDRNETFQLNKKQKSESFLPDEPTSEMEI